MRKKRENNVGMDGEQLGDTANAYIYIDLEYSDEAGLYFAFISFI